MTTFDLFDFYRFMLTTLVVVNCSLRLVSALWRWQAYEQRWHWAPMIRRYFVIHVLRLRFGTFAWDLIQIVGLITLFIVLLRLHV